MAGLIEWADQRYSDIHAARGRFDGRTRDVMSRQEFSATRSEALPLHKKISAARN
jgi:hypothetical protein